MRAHQDLVDSRDRLIDLQQLSLTQPEVIIFDTMRLMISPQAGDPEVGIPWVYEYKDFRVDVFVQVIDEARNLVLSRNLPKYPHLR